MKLLTKEQQESYEKAKIFTIFGKRFKIKLLAIKNIIKLDINTIIQ